MRVSVNTGLTPFLSRQICGYRRNILSTAGQFHVHQTHDAKCTAGLLLNEVYNLTDSKDLDPCVILFISYQERKPNQGEPSLPDPRFPGRIFNALNVIMRQLYSGVQN